MYLTDTKKYSINIAILQSNNNVAGYLTHNEKFFRTKLSLKIDLFHIIHFMLNLRVKN